MLQSIRDLTAHFHISKPSLSLHRLFTTTSPKARKDDPRYPDEESRKAAYSAQALLHRTRYHSDPAFRAAKLKYRRQLYARKKHDNHFRFGHVLNDWVRRVSLVREELPWKTHVPLVYESKVKHFCKGCDWSPVHGLKLWWRRGKSVEEAEEEDEGFVQGQESEEVEKEKSDEYLCHACYVRTRSRFEILPEGYQDVKTLKDIVARKEQLDETATASIVTDKR
jgi:hypothetical protein